LFNLKLIFAFGLSLCLSMEATAKVCTILDRSVEPSNFEHIANADAIVIGQVNSYNVVADNTWEWLTKDIVLVQSLKGDMTKPLKVGVDSLEAGYYANNYPDITLTIIASICSPYYIKPNENAVFLLREITDSSGTFYQAYSVFGRSSGYSFDGGYELWQEIIPIYLEIQKIGDPMQQIEALYSLKKRIRSEGLGYRNQLFLRDIDRHLETMSVKKPTVYIISVLDKIASGEPLGFSRSNACEKADGTIETEVLYPEACIKSDAQIIRDALRTIASHTGDDKARTFIETYADRNHSDEILFELAEYFLKVNRSEKAAELMIRMQSN